MAKKDETIYEKLKNHLADAPSDSIEAFCAHIKKEHLDECAAEITKNQSWEYVQKSIHMPILEESGINTQAYIVTLNQPDVYREMNQLDAQFMRRELLI